MLGFVVAGVEGVYGGEYGTEGFGVLGYDGVEVLGVLGYDGYPLLYVGYDGVLGFDTDGVDTPLGYDGADGFDGDNADDNFDVSER